MQTNVPISELISRRKGLSGLMENNSVLIVFSNQNTARNSDVDWPFRQNSSFWYLTGLNQSDSVLVITKEKERISQKLYTPENDEKSELWYGRKLSKPEVSELSGIYESDISYFKDFAPDIDGFLQNKKFLYLGPKGNYQELRNQIAEKGRIINEKNEIINSNEIIRSLRVVKSNWEIQQMRIAAKINTEAHKKAKKIMQEAVKSGQQFGEKQFEAALYYHYNKNGLTWSYPAIVAGGNNGAVLHYTENNKIIDPNNLVLVDAGCEYNYYASDITRVYSPGGKMTIPQQTVYDIVRTANVECITHLEAGKASFLSLQNTSNEIITKGLIKLGIIKDSFKRAITEKLYKKYYPHSIGHFLGLDVHDIGTKYNNDIFVPGNILTVEPGIYLPENDEDIPKQYRGISIRIEDDILITENGIENLTADLEK